MKKIILFIVLFMFLFNVKADDNDITYADYQKAFVKLNEAYDKFIGACSNEERIAIIKYADGNLDNLKDGYTTIKGLTTSTGKEINDYCANYVEDLYEAIIYGRKYIDSNKMYGLTLETDIIVKTNILVNGSKILTREDLTIVDDCDLIDDKFKGIVNEYIGYIQIVCASITIILCMVDLYKVFISKDVDSKKGFQNMIKRIIALVVVLLAPVIINIIIDIVNRYVDVNALKCLES